MIVSKGVFTPESFPGTIKETGLRKEANKVLMCSPTHFEVVDVKNVHMNEQKGSVDANLALEQWEDIRDVYQHLTKKGILEEVYSLPGAEGCEDMVFTANQSFPWVTDSGEKLVILSKMRHESRKKEVPHFEKFYKDLGYKTVELQNTELFEGMGDAIPQPGRKLIFGGYGHRSSLEAYEEISELLHVPVIALELINDKFYHLDTCFVPLDDESVILYPGAFQPKDLAGLKKIFKDVIEIPEIEAERNFALNAHVINSEHGKAAILQKGSPVTVEALERKGFEVKEMDTSEYMKSGGSVFCMKMMVY